MAITQTFLKRRTKQPVAFLVYESLPQILRELNDGVYDHLDFARSQNSAVKAVLISKDFYDDLIINATGPTPAFSLSLERTDDFVEMNAIKIFDVLAVAADSNDFSAIAIRTTANSLETVAMMLDESYYQALLALQ